jgi:hypothetical protein
MTFHRTMGAIAIAVLCVGLTAMTAVPAYAANGQGSNPNGAFCKLERANLAANSPTSKKEKALAKAMEAGNWKVVQKQLLSLQTQSGKLEQEISSALSSAPAKVKAAAQESFKIIPLELKAIKNSTSVTQFEAALAKVTSGAKFSHAENVIEAYDTSQCGSN